MFVIFRHSNKKDLFLQDMDIKLDLILVIVIELLMECVCGMWGKEEIVRDP